MFPGPDQIVACPHCGALAKYMTLMSGNTFGARMWTDGKQVAPMLPSPPSVVKCSHCRECYWLDDAKEVGTLMAWGGNSQVDPAWIAAEVVREPSEEEYYQALRDGLAQDPQQELNLRVLALWRSNDAFRDVREAGTSGIANTSGACRENLEAIAGLLDEARESERIMKAEVLRELGEFESAQRLLSRAVSGDVATVVHQLRLLCDAEDASVRELQLGR